MKRILFFGRIVRFSFLITFALAIYAFVYLYIESNFDIKNLFLLLFIIVVAIFNIIWIYSMGIFINKKKDSLKIVTDFSKKGKAERVLSNIVFIDVELDGIGMNFIINYKYNCKEKIEYRFYRISTVEKSQYRRIKKQLHKLNSSLLFQNNSAK